MSNGTELSPPRARTQTDDNTFLRRHLGPNEAEVGAMLQTIGFESIEALIDAAIPEPIRLRAPLELPVALSEHDALADLKKIADKNHVCRSFLGMGYSDCIVPAVIQRNILENPGWYTAYTPYQAEIAQGRLEALLNFQTMVTDLTGMEIANASMLDEATAAAEAMALCFHARKNSATQFFVSQNCHPQTIAVVRTRAEPLGIEVIVGDEETFDFTTTVFAALLQYPDTLGVIRDYADFADRAHELGALIIVAADLLALTLIKPPGEFGADVAVGNSQRFGVPLGFGGPHAGYFATRDEFKRLMPGRLVGVSHDTQGRPAYRLALQTREQHIRREKATSNICTAQVLLAVMASMYAVYHGPDGLKAIARRINRVALDLAGQLREAGIEVADEPFFDTLKVSFDESKKRAVELARHHSINLRRHDAHTITISIDETTTPEDVHTILQVLGADTALNSAIGDPQSAIENRTSDFLTHPVFNTHHTETEMLRYIRRLEAKDLSLTTSMIPLGSCTMKLNATSEMLPVSWPEFSKLHPFAPLDQAGGYLELFGQLETWLAEITGFAAVSLQPNAGSQGEYAGLLAIRKFHQANGEGHRNVCLIPQSAHGTNPASAVMAGFRVVPVLCVDRGDIDLDDLRAKTERHARDLAALMVTYPSTHGVFEETIREICDIVHEHGGQVYMDGANMNAQVGLCRPGDIGADVCHLNLHKTFCIPHGGGGPGIGPIGVAEHLAPFLPETKNADSAHQNRISAAPWGSASILVIPWMYIRMMGPDGLTEASRIAILNANYIARRLEKIFPILYRGANGLVAHECILDLRRWKNAGIEVEDVAKRLMDYGFHAPTISWPVAGTMMIEPTESESKDELDRFCEAMISIHAEIKAVENGEADKRDNVLKNAPHTAESVVADDWAHAYSREAAAYPAPWTREHKFWPAVGRIDSVYGDRNLVCSCPPVADYE